jgi:hypothetical protein
MAASTIAVNSHEEKNLTDVWEFIAALGGPASVAAHLGRTKQAVSLWARDGVIPGYLYTSMIELAIERGVAAPEVSFFRFTRKPGTGKGRRAVASVG